MITIRSIEDCNQIENANHRRIITQKAKDLFTKEYLEYYNEHPDADLDFSYFVYFNRYDDITKGVPHLSDGGRGLLCEETIWTGTLEPGWCWEDVAYYEDSSLYEIVIVINNELTVGYFVADGEFINQELKTVLDNFK